MRSPLLRTATSADAASIAGLLTELGYPSDEAATAGRLEVLLARADHEVLVADLAGSVVALCALRVEPSLIREGPQGRITALVVAEEHRGRGIGEALVRAAEGWLVERGAGRVVVNTALHRAGAHAFYDRLGYTRTGTRFARELVTSTRSSRRS